MSYELKLDQRQAALLEFVKKQHGSQKRKYTNVHYWTHVFSVAQIASEYMDDDFVIEIALCHDLFEDTKCTEDDLCYELMRLGYSDKEAIFITSRVDDLTDCFTTERFPAMSRKVRKLKEAQRLGQISAISQSIKYADLIDNTSSIVQHDPNFAKVYLLEKLMILDSMRRGNISLFIKCCFTYHTAMAQLETQTA